MSVVQRVELFVLRLLLWVSVSLNLGFVFVIGGQAVNTYIYCRRKEDRTCEDGIVGSPGLIRRRDDRPGFRRGTVGRGEGCAMCHEHGQSLV